jgi:DNA-binding SARP family transcriptional activator
MRVELLGPVRVVTAVGELVVTARRDRIVLAVLALHVGEAVATPRLIEALWDGDPPRRARNLVHGCIGRLRGQLAGAGAGGEVIATEPAGYRLRVDREAVDLFAFRRLGKAARAAAAAGDGVAASRQFRAALGLWRGPALAGVDSQAVQPTAFALEDERVALLEECLQVELGLGHARQLIGELTELARQHPYREAVHGALMLALYQAGRQAEALAAYRRVRQRIRDELGTEPGRDLQDLHRAILNREPRLGTAPAPPPRGGGPPQARPRELPPAVTAFTGRHDALKTLAGALPGGEAAVPAPLTVLVITGSAGVGKTTLAVHWAHRVAGDYPDGQLCVDLRGHAAGPALSPIGALGLVLRSLGVPPAEIPSEVAPAVARYRSLMAGRRVLVLLDNAASADQVRPLLPGSAGNLVLVTSRHRLPGLVARDGARQLALDVFSSEEARALLTRVLGAERVEAEPAAAAALAAACAHLPLALRVAAASLLDSPRRTIGSYVTDLVAGDRLGALQADGDQGSAVRAALEVSYLAIPTAAQRMFRRLGLAPVPDLTAPAAAAIAGMSLDEARSALRQLTAANLLDEQPAGRYRFHDLLRLYARQLAEAEDGQEESGAAVGRLLTWYLRGADAAARLLHAELLRLPLPATDAAAAVELASFGEALAWLEAERSNLVAAVAHSAEHRLRPPAWLLADRLRGYFSHRRHISDWRTVAEAGLAAANRDGDRQARAAAHFHLAHLHQCLSRFQDALEHYTTAVDLAGQAGWPACGVAALTNLGNIYRDLGQLEKSVDHHRRALATNQDRGDLGAQLVNRINLGAVERQRGRLRTATGHLHRALRLSRRPGYQHGAAAASSALAETYHDLCRLDAAAVHFARALALYREVGDRAGTAAALSGLAAVELDAGRHAEARRLARESAGLADEIGDRRWSAAAYHTLGRVCLRLGEAAQAIEHHQAALTLARQAGVRSVEISALLGIAAVHQRSGEDATASRYAEHSLELARSTGFRLLEGQASTLLSEIHGGRPDRSAAG